ncbi:MAG: hypothetical protein KAJ19_22740 [Gammaproteobacteria bacterium]|nr:hypothetical protein [Gammaproteobacteria bacterium]
MSDEFAESLSRFVDNWKYTIGIINIHSESIKTLASRIENMENQIKIIQEILIKEGLALESSK